MKSKLALILFLVAQAGLVFAAETDMQTSSDAFWYQSSQGVPCCD